MTLAAAQTTPVAGDVAANLGQHLRLAALAAREGAELLVFPELSLTGYELELAPALAFDLDDARLAPLARAARETRATLIAGAPVRIGDRLHVGAFVLASDGSVDLYTKRHLGAFGPDANPGGRVPPPEASVFAPGDRDPRVRLRAGEGAIAICADLARPAHAAAAAARGAAFYLACTFVTPSALDDDRASLRDRAVRHALTVVFANFGGPSGGLASGGGSAIWSPAGERVAALGPSGAGVALAASGPAGWQGWTIAA